MNIAAVGELVERLVERRLIALEGSAPVPLPPVDVDPPTHADLVRDLARWRERGVLRLRSLELPFIRQAALAAGDAATPVETAEPAVLTELLRASLAPIAGSVTGRCALVLLGLDPATFDLAPNLLREDASEIYGVGIERFRRDPQAQILGTTADKILERCYTHRARLTRLAMEQRHPADSRLAVKWLERFESYFKLWSPIYALGADLTAYRSTLLDPERPYDRDLETDGPEDPGYSQEEQAAGYGTFALYRLACVLAAEEQFTARYGGLWLLSTPNAEADARDALADAKRHLPTNERDHSLLRALLDSAGGEMHPFLEQLQQESIGAVTHDEWQIWRATCACVWDETKCDPTVEYFPTARYHGGISPACAVHQTIEACNRYCTVLEQEWLRIADWYQSERSRSSDALTAVLDP